MLVPYDLWEAIRLLPKVPPKPTGEVRRRLDPLLTQRKLQGLRTVMHPALPDKGGPKQSIAVPGVLAKVGPRLHLTFPRLSLRSTRTTWQGQRMAITAQVGSVTGLWRFPVKSMRGERLDEAHVTERGLVGDRAYALIDTDTGKVVSAKSVKRFPDLLACRAAFVQPPGADDDLPPVEITLPDGSTVRSDTSDVSGALSTFFQRDVTWPGLRRRTSPS